MRREKLKFGVMGCGLVSQFHGKAINGARGAVLVAAADKVRERAVQFAETYGGEALDIDEMFRREDIDVINVLTPNAYHEEYVVRAARAGKHVVVEKPPEVALDKVDHMIAECDKAGVKLGVVLQCRFRKGVEAIKKVMDEGRFGRLLHGDVYMKWYRPREYYLGDAWRRSRAQGAGVTIQQAFHYIDLLYYLMGPVRKVWARMTNLAHPEVDLEDTVIAVLDYENGAQGILEASTALCPGTDLRIEINGEKGTAIMEGERITAWKFADERPEDDGISRIGSQAAQTAATGAADFSFYEHQYLIEDMIDAIQSDRSPRVTGYEGRASLEIALALYKSADTHEEVSLPLSYALPTSQMPLFQRGI